MFWVLSEYVSGKFWFFFILLVCMETFFAARCMMLNCYQLIIDLSIWFIKLWESLVGVCVVAVHILTVPRCGCRTFGTVASGCWCCHLFDLYLFIGVHMFDCYFNFLLSLNVFYLSVLVILMKDSLMETSSNMWIRSKRLNPAVEKSTQKSEFSKS